MRLLSAILLVSAFACGAGAARDAPAGDSLPYAEGVVLDVHVPEDVNSRAPVVVLVHGCCGDRRDTAALARALARRGAVVVNPDVHAVGHGGGWPRTYQDVKCAVGEAGEVAERLGGEHPLAIVAWSDGALAGAAVVLGWNAADIQTTRCLHAPERPIDRFIGLAGFYGWADEAALAGDAAAAAWFGGSLDDLHNGNPFDLMGVAALDSRVPFLLVTGDEDPLEAGARQFHEALLAGGFEAELVSVARANHLELVHPRSEGGWTALTVVSGALGLTRRNDG